MQSSIKPMQVSHHRVAVMSPSQTNLFCIACARRNRFAMGALDLVIEQGYESADLYVDLPDDYVRGVAGGIDLAAPGQS